MCGANGVVFSNCSNCAQVRELLENWRGGGISGISSVNPVIGATFSIPEQSQEIFCQLKPMEYSFISEENSHRYQHSKETLYEVFNGDYDESENPRQKSRVFCEPSGELSHMPNESAQTECVKESSELISVESVGDNQVLQTVSEN